MGHGPRQCCVTSNCQANILSFLIVKPSYQAGSHQTDSNIIVHVIVHHKQADWSGIISWRSVHLVVVTAEVTAEALLEVTVRLLLLGVVLVVLAVVLVVELLGVLAGLALGLLAVDEVGALGLGETVDLTTGETGEELLCEAVGDGLAC